jgi:hypothetical protein
MTITLKDRIEAKEYDGYGDPNDILNMCDVELMKLPPVECPLTHRFTPGMYIREIFMPKGSIVTSLLHLTTHPFFILKGDVNVYYPGLPVERYIAPYTGVTKAGTRRLLYNNEDTVWITCHITDLTDPDEIMESITANDFNPLIDKNDTRVNTWRNNLQPSLPQ